VQKNLYLAASAALVFLAVLVRLAYAWRLGVSPRADLLLAGAACVWVVGAVGYRAGGPWAAAAASLVWAALPAAVVANTFSPAETYAALAGAASLYFFLKFRADGKTPDALAAGLCAGVAVAFSFAYLALAAFYLLWSITATWRKDGPGARALLWLGGFIVIIAAAAVLEYVRVGEPFAHLRGVLAAAPAPYAETKWLIKRLGTGAAAMLFWDPLGFGLTTVVGLAAAAYYVGTRDAAGRPLGALFVLTLVALNFAPTSPAGYVPMTLEPTKWLVAALPAAVLAGAAAGELWTSGNAPGRWAGSFGLAAILAVLFVSGNKLFAPVNLGILGLAALATLALAGAARRGGEDARRRCGRAAAAIIILISIWPVLILYF